MELVDRVNLLCKAEQNKKLQMLCYEMCTRDPVYWFNTFCYTFDPRSQDPEMPFNLYPYQEWCIYEWYACIENQVDFGIEKSRDMGVSWMLILLFQYCWLFRPGWNFLVGSRKEAEVDTAILDPSTLFGKFRYNLTKLPRWMKPKFNDKKLSFWNESNGNLVTGESANPAFGRGPRQRAVLFDELAYWDCADAAYGGCAATTKCRIVNSTPNGETNKFGQVMLDPNNELRLPPDDKVSIALESAPS